MKDRSSAEKALSGCTWESTPAWSLKGLRTWGRVIKVVDGDSICVAMVVQGKPYKFNVRLFGIDTAEMRSKDPLAEKAKRKLSELLLGDEDGDPKVRVCLVWLECYDFDKYGRLLARVYAEPRCEKCVSQCLLDAKLAYPYFGATKLDEKEQKKLLQGD